MAKKPSKRKLISERAIQGSKIHRKSSSKNISNSYMSRYRSVKEIKTQDRASKKKAGISRQSSKAALLNENQPNNGNNEQVPTQGRQSSLERRKANLVRKNSMDNGVNTNQKNRSSSRKDLNKRPVKVILPTKKLCNTL